MKKAVLEYPGIFSLIWALVIFVLCATPGKYIPSVSWLELLSFDKFVHASVFFILVVFLLLYVAKNGRGVAQALFFVVAAIVYGALLELMQAYWFSERSADVYDMVANSFGCLTAGFFLKKLQGIYQH